MPGEFNNESTNGSARFFPSAMPDGLDVVIADPGCAPYQILGYRRAGDVCHQAWPPTKLPAGLFDADPSKRQEALVAFGTAQESVETRVLAEVVKIKEMLTSTVVHPADAIGLGESLGLRPKIEEPEATQDNLSYRVQAPGASSPCTGAATPKAAKSRRGSKHRAGGLTCEEQMLLLSEADPTVMFLTPPGIHAHMVARWGEENAFSIRKIRSVKLYKDWRLGVETLRKNLKMAPADVAEEGLAILSHKPGREDKRRVGRAQHEQATRMFLALMSNANIAAKRGSEAARAARDQHGRQ